MMGAALALALVRIWLNPPLHPMLYWLLPTWYAVAAVYYLVQPGVTTPAWFRFVLRFSFFCYEAVAVVIICHFLGGSGWLAILLLLLPVLELNLAFPGLAAALSSVFAVACAGGMTLLEAQGWLSHDPFYSVGAPLYSQPAYVAAVYLIGLVFLVAVPAWVASYARSRS
jgi:hypothetical protein